MRIFGSIPSSRERTLLRCILLSACLLALGACGEKEQPRILGEEPLERVVRVEDEIGAIRAWAESGARADVLVRFDSSDDIEIVPPELAESMKNAADHLARGNTAVLEKVEPLLRRSGVVALGRAAGLYERVIWVLPMQSSVSSLPLDGFRSFLVSRRGFRPEDLADLTVEEPYITGTIGGVPLTITNWRDLDLGGETAIVDIDLSFFTGIPGTPTGFGVSTALGLEFLRNLREKRIQTRLVTVTLSNTTRAVPVGVRYLGSVIFDALLDPTHLGQSPPEALTAAAEAERAMIEERLAAADSLYRRLVEMNPLDPGAHFALAMAGGLLGKANDCASHLDEAYRLDPVYALGLFQAADILASRGRLETAVQVVGSSAAREAYTERDLDYRIGVMYVRGGAPAQALPFLQKAAAIEGNFDLYNLIFRAARDAGDDQGMIVGLEGLMETDIEMVTGHLPWVFRELAALYEKRGDNESASRMRRLYLQAAPDSAEAPQGRTRQLKRM